jgi:hypothetical protein
MTSHILVEVSKVHVGKLLQTQHSCMDHAPSVPARPMWGDHSARQYLPTYPKGSSSPWPQALGGHVHLSPPGLLGQMNLVSVTSGPKGRPREVCFLFMP